MAGFGTVLGGFGNAYPQYQAQQADLQTNQLQQQEMKQKLAQAIQKMQQDQQTRQQFSEASKKLSTMHGAGEGGVYTPEQRAALSDNPDVQAQLRELINPYNTGQFGLQGRQISGQNALERTALAGDNAMARTQLQQEGADTRNQLSNQTRQDIVGQQQEGANTRNAASNTVRQNIAASRPAAQSAKASSPAYKTATKEFDEATKDEQAIQNNYGRLGNYTGYLNDPEWLAARKRKVAAQTKLEKLSDAEDKASKEAPAAAPVESHPLPPGAEKFPDGTEIPDSTGATWIKQGNVLVPKQ